jgi:hypothetical protein
MEVDISKISVTSPISGVDNSFRRPINANYRSRCPNHFGREQGNVTCTATEVQNSRSLSNSSVREQAFRDWPNDL